MSNKQTIFTPEERDIFCTGDALKSMKRFIVNYEIFAVIVMTIILLVLCYSVYTGECVPVWVSIILIVVIILKLFYLWQMNPMVLSKFEKIVAVGCQ
jgi:hypothetical protein